MIDEIFQALDKDKKGYVGDLDFCDLAEERRRNIDAFGEKDIAMGKAKQTGYYETKSPFDTSDNFVHNYLDHSSASDLEAMSKWLKPSAVMKTTSATNGLKLSE